MGTEVHSKSSFEGYYSMGDVNEDSNSSSWPLFYGDKTLSNGHYYNSYIPRTVADANSGCDKDGLKQKMLEHEAVFKNQVFELHRLYRRQRDMMEEVKRNEYHKHRISMDTSPSYEDSQKWQIPKWNNNNNSLKDCEIMESRPSKARKKLFDLELLPDDNVDHEHASEESSYSGVGGLADLNTPVNVVEPLGHSSVNGLWTSSKPNGPPLLDPTRETGITNKVQDGYRFTPLPFPTLCSPTDLGKFRGKSNGGLTQKLTSFQKQPSFLPSPPSHAVFGDKLHMNGCYTPNRFYHGSSSGSKDPYTRLPSGGFDHRNYNNLDDRSQKIYKGSNFIDLTDTTKGVDLNNNSSRNSDQTVLPWLQSRPNTSKNEKNLGFSVFGNSCISKNESSSLVSTSASLQRPCENGKIKSEMENRGFDINVAWDDHENKQIDAEDIDIGKKPNTDIDRVKNNFDLNSCLTEEEDVLVPEKVKTITMEIDLEVPAVPEEEEAVDDEFLAKGAAEAIVAMTELTGISSQQDQVGSTSESAVHSDDNDRLLWFVEVVENAGERDEYEELTLKQELTKEEDYMPKPLAPDFQEPDEAGPSSGLARPRRGQARRGRHRRDFQRDILPGLVSLSRHEVTEDLQIFGGLMRATGHSWNAGLTRRTGTKGRRKSVAVVVEPPPPAPTPPPPPPLLEVVGLEDGSLTGWGKTPRRPRRQRCAAGNSVLVPPS